MDASSVMDAMSRVLFKVWPPMGDGGEWRKECIQCVPSSVQSAAGSDHLSVSPIRSTLAKRQYFRLLAMAAIASLTLTTDSLQSK